MTYKASEPAAGASKLKISKRTVNVKPDIPGKAAPDTGAPIPEGVWVCRYCESMNDRAKSKCGVCGANKY